MRLALALQLAGAMGNLVDCLTVGAVTDFISVLRLPVFNIADLSITTGVIVAAICHKFRGNGRCINIFKQARDINARYWAPSNYVPKPAKNTYSSR